jgi:hypothetical protein
MIMRDLHRNPILYYLLIPILIGIWPLLVWGMYLPKAEENLQNDCDLLEKGNTFVKEILELDPDRISVQGEPNQVASRFAYGTAVDRVANLCGIPSGSCNSTAGDIIKVSGKERQDARVKLKDVGIVQVASFLSKIQSTYTGLQCDQVKLTKRKGMPDQWEVDFRFIYYY